MMGTKIRSIKFLMSVFLVLTAISCEELSSEANEKEREPNTLVVSFINLTKDTVNVEDYLAADLIVYSCDTSYNFKSRRYSFFDSLDIRLSETKIIDKSSVEKGCPVIKSWTFYTIKPADMTELEFRNTLKKVVRNKNIVLQSQLENIEIDSVECDEIYEELTYQRRY